MVIRGRFWVFALFFSAGVAACGSSPDAPSGEGGFKGTEPPASTGGESGTGGQTTLDLPTGDPQECQPTTCEELGKNCGVVADGCGDLLDCGSCSGGEECGILAANVCTDPSGLCQPLSREEACAGKECGVEGDGCGGTHDCGSCADGEACGQSEAFQCDLILVNDPNACPGRIESCADVGAECGVIGNGCGGILDCTAETGGCASGTYCGLGGPQKCGADFPECTPVSPAEACAGKCGVVSNGCGPEVNGGVIDCSALYPCPTGQACGAAGVPNQCGNADGVCQPIAQATACGGNECGAASDGCDGSYSCGSCAQGEICRSGQCEAICQPVPQATACAGMECGLVGDGCGSTYDCGGCPSGEQCGAIQAFTCDPIPPAECVPESAQTACAGKECGIVYDGCGTDASHQIDCGSCGSGEYCGIQQAYQCDAPTTNCTPGTSCASLGWECGLAVDECGNVFDCASEGRTCGALQTCIGGINAPAQCVSGGNTGDCPLCDAVPDCSGASGTTRLTGRVVTPGRSDSNTGNQVGVPNATVYVLRTNDAGDLPAVSTGVPSNGSSCDRCDGQDLGPVLASASTDAEGNYTLEGNIPVGQEMLLVVKVGKFRRATHYTVPATGACKTTSLPTSLPGNPTRLPRSMSDGLAVNIPKIAVSTGQVDAMECVFEKMGVADSEFTRPALSGRVHLYRSNGAWPDEQSERCYECSWSSCRATYCGGSDSSDRTAYLNALDDQRLYEDGGRINEYDMVVFDCEGGGWGHHNSSDPNVREYVNRGGRMFASHFSFHWICDNGSTSYSSSNPYVTGLAPSANFEDCYQNGSYPSSGTGYVSLGRPGVNTPKLQDFATWLVNEGAASLSGGRYQFTINQPRDLATSVNAYSEEFVYRETGSSSTSVQQYSFNTPYGAPDAAVCGRVAYSGFHVTASGSSSSNFGSEYFPQYCSGNLTAQEKVLLYMLFDLGACVGEEPEPPACTPVACSPNTCGAQPDGCGGYNDCSCSGGDACVDGQCVPPNCTATTCQAEGATCGLIADGCGGTLDCGQCPVCDPIPEAEACGGQCGFVSDGCGGVYECPDCSGGLTCVAGQCMAGSCDPLTACPANYDCGEVSDGCNGTIACGTCQAPEACGGGGMPNVCGVPECHPLTCEDVGASCGLIGNGCGGTVDCGQCPAGQACGVGGVANQCAGCQPRTCQDAGAECGAIGDGCGGILECGTCTGGLVCGAQSPNQCGPGESCDPQSCQDLGAECGLVGDGCGGQLDCGVCPVGQLCGIVSHFQCDYPPECTPTTCEDAGAECGAIGDGCGGQVDCGVCPQGLICGLNEPHRCDGVVVR